MRRWLPFVLVALAGCGADADAPEPVAAPAFTPAKVAAPAPEPAGRYPIARLTRPAMLRTRPGGRMVGRVRTRTEFGSSTRLSVVGRREGWLEVVSPQRPNGRSAWIPADAASLSATDYAIHVDRSARRITLRRGARVLRRMTVAVGRAGNATPTGRFAVTDRLRTGRPDSPYGCCIVALTGHQTRLVPGWAGGDRLAIHTTPQRETIGTAASLGCLRGGRADVEFLLRRVPLGTPVFIRA